MFGHLTSNFRPSDQIAPQNISDRLSELKFFDTQFSTKTLAFILQSDFFAAFLEKTPYFLRIHLTVPLEIVS